MQRLEVSGAVRLIYKSLGVKESSDDFPLFITNFHQIIRSHMVQVPHNISPAKITFT